MATPAVATGQDAERVSSSAASSSIVITFVRAAASSIASGIPSSRRTTGPPGRSARSGRSRGRSPARRTAGPRRRVPAGPRHAAAPAAGTTYTLSPGPAGAHGWTRGSRGSGSTPAGRHRSARRSRRRASSCRRPAAGCCGRSAGDLLDQPGALQQVQTRWRRRRVSDGGRIVQTRPAAPSRRRPGSCPASSLPTAIVETGLAHTTRSGEGQQAGDPLAEEACGGGELGRAADQLVRRCGWLAQIGGRALSVASERPR